MPQKAPASQAAQAFFLDHGHGAVEQRTSGFDAARAGPGIPFCGFSAFAAFQIALQSVS